MKCKNCSSQLSEHQNYCDHCGTSIQVKRIDAQFIFNEFQQIFNFEKGILFTIRELTFNSGKAVREYLNGDRKRLVKPIFFILALSIFYTLINEWFNSDNFTIKDPRLSGLNWISSNIGNLNLILSIFLTFWSKLFFRKSAFNFLEIFVFYCYVTGMTMLMLSIITLIQTGLNLSQNFSNQFGFLATSLFFILAMVQFYSGKKIYLVFKSLLVLLSSYVTILIFIIVFVVLSRVFNF
jgi:hypothetical protein